MAADSRGSYRRITFALNILALVLNILLLLASTPHYQSSSGNAKAATISCDVSTPASVKSSFITSSLHRPLHYGVEFAFLYPVQVYRNLTSPFQLQARKLEALVKLRRDLQQEGVPVIIADRKTESLGSWKMASERSGIEIASPLSPSYSQIQRLLAVVGASGFVVHPELTIAHINIDARNRTVSQTRNVYKNIMAVEKALDQFRYPRKTAVAGEAKSLVESFASVQEAYASMDNSTTFSSHIVLGDQESVSKKKTHRRVTVGLKLREREEEMLPNTFEFRGLEASLDPAVAISWLELALKILSESYAGHVLAPVERTAEEAHDALFVELVRDKKLGDFFRTRSDGFRISVPEVEKLTAEYCSHPDLKDKYREALQCKKDETTGKFLFNEYHSVPPRAAGTRS